MTARRAVNLSIDAGLLADAKAAGFNLSSMLEAAVRERLRAQRKQEWLEENRAAIEASNKELAENGMWYTPDWIEP